MTAKQKEPVRAESILWTGSNLFKGIYITGVACALYFGLRSEIRENKATQTGIDNVQNTRLDYLEGKKTTSQYPLKPEEINLVEE